MAYILNIETSTTNCSVSLSKDGETLVLKEDYNDNYSHDERLHEYINHVLNAANLHSSQLDAIAISKGPGSYTGLRIGVSAAKGLCFALDKPLIAISTLESLAHQIIVEKGLIVPMLDARRMEVYSSVFNSELAQIRETQAQVLEETSFNEYLEKDNVYFIGNGVEKTKNLITHPKAIFIENKLPSAKEMGALANKKFLKKDFENVAYFEPYYLKDFISFQNKT